MIPAASGRPSDGWLTPRRFAAILALLVLLSFYDVVVGGRAFFYRDYGVLAYPTVHYFRESFWRGELPLWNPLSNCGTPFLAQWGTMVLYPGALFYLLAPLPWSLGVFCLGHLFLGGFGMYLLARRWTGSGFGGGIAGLAFTFNGVALSCLLWPNYTVALGWMPWVVMLAERAWAEGGRTLVLAAWLAALQALAGVPEITLLTWLVLGCLWLGTLLRGSPAPARATCRFVAVLLLMAGLTAAQTLPFADLLAHSQRSAGFATAKWALPVWGVGNLIAPLFHCFQTTRGLFFQHGQEFFSSTYLGAGLVALAVWAACRVQRKRALWLAGLGLFGLALALGEDGPLYRWLRVALPLTGFARYPVKALLLLAFAAPLLAAFAASQWEGMPQSAMKRETRWLAGIGFLLLVVMAGLVWTAREHPLPLDQWPAMWRNTLVRAVLLLAVLGCWGWLMARRGVAAESVTAGGLLLLFVWGDFLSHLPRQNPTIPGELFAPGMAQMSPKPAPGDSRVMISPRAEESLLRSRVPDFEQDFIGKRLAMWSNLNLVEGVPKISGAATLQLREQAQVQSLLYATATTELPGLADFLGAAWITSPTNLVEWMRRESSLPLVTAGQEPVFVPAAALPAALARPGFDGRRQVFLPEDVRGRVTVTNAAQATIHSLEFAAHEVRFTVKADAPTWVVVAQSYYHPWRAFVNGQPARIWRANHAFQALEAPVGENRVRLVYQDRKFRLGAGISALTLAGSMAGWIWLRRKGPPPGQ